jgi:glutathione-specific gamma-glutamylcyclotransferase
VGDRVNNRDAGWLGSASSGVPPPDPEWLQSAASGLWVFGYGSLMWDPGFVHAEALPALLYGWHRSLCILSIRNRGTVERPGLALGLDRGGACRGIAFRIAPGEVEAACAYLWAREMSHGVYRAMMLKVRLDGGGRTGALTFVARQDHPQYVRGLPMKAAAALVLQGRGAYGTSLDYLRNVIEHLDATGIRDGPLHAVLNEALRARRAAATTGLEPEGLDD